MIQNPPPGRCAPRWSGRTRLTAFLVIAYAASWWAWPLVLLNPTTTALVPIGPTIAAIVVTALGGGAGELRTLLAAWSAGRYTRSGTR